MISNRRNNQPGDTSSENASTNSETPSFVKKWGGRLVKGTWYLAKPPYGETGFLNDIQEWVSRPNQDKRNEQRVEIVDGEQLAEIKVLDTDLDKLVDKDDGTENLISPDAERLRTEGRVQANTFQRNISEMKAIMDEYKRLKDNHAEDLDEANTFFDNKKDRLNELKNLTLDSLDNMDQDLGNLWSEGSDAGATVQHEMTTLRPKFDQTCQFDIKLGRESLQQVQKVIQEADTVNQKMFKKIDNTVNKSRRENDLLKTGKTGKGFIKFRDDLLSTLNTIEAETFWRLQEIAPEGGSVLSKIGSIKATLRAAIHPAQNKPEGTIFADVGTLQTELTALSDSMTLTLRNFEGTEDEIKLIGNEKYERSKERLRFISGVSKWLLWTALTATSMATVRYGPTAVYENIIGRALQDDESGEDNPGNGIDYQLSHGVNANRNGNILTFTFPQGARYDNIDANSDYQISIYDEGGVKQKIDLINNQFTIPNGANGPQDIKVFVHGRANSQWVQTGSWVDMPAK